MIQLAIVSSYSESCGNAAFTKVLVDSIGSEGKANVSVIELDLRLLQAVDKLSRKKGDLHILKICEELQKFDAVNIQLESGLYGTIPSDIIHRVRKLVRAHRRTSVTLHSPRLKKGSPADVRAAISQILKFRLISGFRLVFTAARVHVKINVANIKSAIGAGCSFIVHTPRAKKDLDVFFNYRKVWVHPLKIVSDNFNLEAKSPRDHRALLGLGPDAKLVGIFGYISAYKGHHDALKAIRMLPKDYHLLVFGRQHPQTIKSDGKIDAYLGKLIRETDTRSTYREDVKNGPRTFSNFIALEKSIRKRVHFLGELDDEEFIQAAAGVDVAWLPYYENGQDGSGIISICLDVCPRVVASQSNAFTQLFRLMKYRNVQRFDIGNYLELATRTRIMMAEPPPKRPYVMSGDYTVVTQARAYLESVEA